MLCPKCNVEMDEVRKLEVIVDSCSRCGGIWLDKGELEKLRGAWREYRESVQEEYQPQQERHEKRYDDRYDKHKYDEHYGKPHSGRHKKKKGWMEIFEIFD